MRLLLRSNGRADASSNRFSTMIAAVTSSSSEGGAVIAASFPFNVVDLRFPAAVPC